MADAFVLATHMMGTEGDAKDKAYVTKKPNAKAKGEPKAIANVVDAYVTKKPHAKAKGKGRAQSNCKCRGCR